MTVVPNSCAPLISSEADAVVILPRLIKYGEETSVLLVKQFRPPVGAYTVELPAGVCYRRWSGKNHRGRGISMSCMLSSRQRAEKYSQRASEVSRKYHDHLHTPSGVSKSICSGHQRIWKAHRVPQPDVSKSTGHRKEPQRNSSPVHSEQPMCCTAQHQPSQQCRGLPRQNSSECVMPEDKPVPVFDVWRPTVNRFQKTWPKGNGVAGGGMGGARGVWAYAGSFLGQNRNQGRKKGSQPTSRSPCSPPCFAFFTCWFPSSIDSNEGNSISHNGETTRGVCVHNMQAALPQMVSAVYCLDT